MSMIKPTLLVLAAGMGSRYGGLKQIDPVGPGGETIIDYSVYDALRAGFGKLVFVIRRDIERAFRELIGSRFEGRIHVDYVFQELQKVPSGVEVPPNRAKPWGTCHAVLVAGDAIQEPFAVINGDDFYGRHSFEVLARFLEASPADYAMVGFVLKNTLSEFGTVARGLCSTAADHYLQSVVELTQIRKEGAGASYTDPAGKVHPLTGEETVSMNMWGFTPRAFDQFCGEFSKFLESNGRNEKAEFYIPSAVNALLQARQARVKVLSSRDSWFGITYREDKPRVVDSIRQLVARGDYPAKLTA
jgi:NDP-sugar pyrophosphorylase family protein